MLKQFYALALALLCCATAQAQMFLPVERKAILDAARPVAARLAHQPVLIKVDRLNVDSNWALLIGELRAPSGKEPNWSLSSCAAELDKMLWVVLNKSGTTWAVKHIEICATEPPHWDLQPFGGLVWPCGVYAGLQSAQGQPLEETCRATPQRKE